MLLQPLNNGPVAQALALNNNGGITGTAGSSSVNPGQHAVRWSPYGDIINRDSTFNISAGSVINDAGVIGGVGSLCPPDMFMFLTGVADINDAGKIAATGRMTTGSLGEVAVLLEPVAAADLNADGYVDVDDLIALILAWRSDDEVADIINSGVVDVDDLMALILAWG